MSWYEKRYADGRIGFNPRVGLREFKEVFKGVASARKVALVPSFFAGFGEDLSYFQADRIHPTAQAQSRLLDNVWPQLVPLLKR